MNSLPSPQKIANVYQGNPQALQQRVQQGQSQPQQPGQLPPNLIDLLALNMVNAQKEAAQRQLTMQQGGGQKPTVMQQEHEKAMTSARQEIQQKIGTLQNQGQQQQQGIQALAQSAGQAQAQGGGGIDQLPTGQAMQGMAGGGIVGFSGENDSDVKDPEMTDAKGDVYRYNQEGHSSTNTPYLESISKALGFPVDVLKMLVSAPNQTQYKSKKEESKPAQPRVEPRDKTARDPANYRPYGVEGATDKPENKGSGAAAAGARSSNKGIMTGMDEEDSEYSKYLEKKQRGIMDTDEGAYRDSQQKWYKDQLGLDPMLKSREARYAAHEALKAKQDESRKSEEIGAILRGFAGAKPDLAAAATAGSGAGAKLREGWQGADLKFSAEMMKLRDDLDEARATGNKAAADQALKAMEQLRDQKERAMQGGVNLETNRVTNKTRLQTARDAAADRAQRAQLGADEKVSRLIQLYQSQMATEVDKRVDNERAAHKDSVGNVAKTFDVASATTRARQAVLRENPEYIKLLKKAGLESPLTSSSPTPAPTKGSKGWSNFKAN